MFPTPLLPGFHRQMADHGRPHERHGKTQIKSRVLAVPSDDNRLYTALPNVLAIGAQRAGYVMQRFERRPEPSQYGQHGVRGCPVIVPGIVAVRGLKPITPG